MQQRHGVVMQSTIRRNLQAGKSMADIRMKLVFCQGKKIRGDVPLRSVGLTPFISHFKSSYRFHLVCATTAGRTADLHGREGGLVLGLQYVYYEDTVFLPRDASAERGNATVSRLSVRLYVCLSVTFRYQQHIGWNSWKIISRPNSLRPVLWLTPNMGDLVQREHPKIRVE